MKSGRFLKLNPKAELIGSLLLVLILGMLLSSLGCQLQQSQAKKDINQDAKVMSQDNEIQLTETEKLLLIEIAKKDPLVHELFGQGAFVSKVSQYKSNHSTKELAIVEMKSGDKEWYVMIYPHSKKVLNVMDTSRVVNSMEELLKSRMK